MRGRRGVGRRGVGREGGEGREGEREEGVGCFFAGFLIIYSLFFLMF